MPESETSLWNRALELSDVCRGTQQGATVGKPSLKPSVLPCRLHQRYLFSARLNTKFSGIREVYLTVFLKRSSNIPSVPFRIERTRWTTLYILHWALLPSICRLKWRLSKPKAHLSELFSHSPFYCERLESSLGFGAFYCAHFFSTLSLTKTGPSAVNRLLPGDTIKFILKNSLSFRSPIPQR